MASLNIPRQAKCLVPGCKGKPTHILSLRMRRQDSGASWAPNQPAYFCDNHANNGSEIFIFYMPTRSGENAVHTTAGNSFVHRTTGIR